MEGDTLVFNFVFERFSTENLRDSLKNDMTLPIFELEKFSHFVTSETSVE